MKFLKTNLTKCMLLVGYMCLSTGLAKAQSGAVIKEPVKSFETIRNVFKLGPDSITTGVYWYWLSGNISKTGVVKDLEAMKKVGINRAYIGNIFLDNVDEGKVKLFSDAWWDILHAALKRAGELDIKIGIFNSPGWSQSGGPWVKPNQAMRFLTSSAQQLQGPINQPIQLKQPKAVFQDVKVVAYPVANDFDQYITKNNAKLTADPAIQNIDYLFDGNTETKVELKDNAELLISIHTNQPQTIRSLEMLIAQQAIHFKGELQVKKDGAYQTVKSFEVDRSNPSVNVGWEPYGSAVTSIEAVTAQDFRLKLSKLGGSGALTEVRLSGTPKIENYIEKSLAKMFQSPLPLANAYTWPVQPVQSADLAIDPQKVVDVTAYLDANGALNWKVPKGNWVIERFGMSPTGTENSPAAPEGRGAEIDKMNKQHTQTHFDAYVGQILKRIPAADRKTLTTVVADSYEVGGQNWTDDLEKKFKQVYHYDPIPFLPVLSGKVIGSADQSDRFLWDLRRLIADEVAYSYVGALTSISKKNGMSTWLENYGHWGFPGEFLQYGGQADEIGGEFWAEGDLGNIENRAASSAAHIYGKKRVFSESFTAGGQAFARYPAMLKKRADRFFTEGINSTILHVYIAQSDEVKNPGVATWFGTEFNRKNTWFNDMDIFLQYLKRCGFMLQQGNYVADVAYFIGEDAPKMTGEQSPPLPKGYAFDYINAEVIKNRLGFDQGKLSLPDGLGYNILVLPNSATIRPALLQKIGQLVAQGAVVLGKKPQRSPSLQDFPTADQNVNSLANKLWGDIDGKQKKVNAYGKGMVIDGMDLEEAFTYLKIQPDFTTSGKDSILFIHRSLPNSEVYFLSNQGNLPVKTNATFRVANRTPELWNPTNGTTRLLPQFTQDKGTTQLPIALGAGESTFVVFTTASAKIGQAKPNYPEPLRTVAITKPWTVTFQPMDEKAYQPIQLDTLVDWSKSRADSLKYFSGTAIYTNQFKVPKTNKQTETWLDLGQVYAIAKVKINGVAVGGVWTAPYRINISKAIKSGNNQIEVSVVNTWKNSLVGDAKLPLEQRKTAVGPTLDISGGLQASGLIGPVKIYTIQAQ